jgi:molybdopterin synthase catalytic subunit
MKIGLLTTALDPWKEIVAYQQSIDSMHGKYGATASFVGTMRDFNEGDDVVGMTLEYYPKMTEGHLQQIVTTAQQNWDILDVLVLHRVGELLPNDPIVLVAVWSPHRAAAFDACRFIMEELKSNAPFWKKESLRQGARWVEKNTAG